MAFAKITSLDDLKLALDTLPKDQQFTLREDIYLIIYDDPGDGMRFVEFAPVSSFIRDF